MHAPAPSSALAHAHELSRGFPASLLFTYLTRIRAASAALHSHTAGAGAYWGGLQLSELLSPLTFTERCARCHEGRETVSGSGQWWRRGVYADGSSAAASTGGASVLGLDLPPFPTALPTSPPQPRAHCSDCFSFPTRAAFCSLECLGEHRAKHERGCKGSNRSGGGSGVGGGGGGAGAGGGGGAWPTSPLLALA